MATALTSKDNLKAKLLNRWSFSAKSTREELSPGYFAFADNIQDDVMPFLEEMKQKHKKCPYWKLLKHYCPCAVDIAVKSNKSKKWKFPEPSHTTLLANNCTIKSIYCFVCAVLKRLIPLELFGNLANRKIFFRNIEQILWVQKYGAVSLHQLVRGIRISKISWLSNYNPLKPQEQLLICVDFLITRVVCPLIESFFFTVESSYAKIKLFMFRKRVWHRLRQKAFVDYVKFCKLQVIAQRKVKDLVNQGKCLGCSKLNFILKKNCLRPISNVSFHEKGKESINDRLKTLLVVLNYEKIRNKDSFGATAMGMIEFHRKFRDCIMTVQKEKFKRLYFVTADIEKCFDCIQPSLLLKIALKIMESDSYVVNKYRRFFSRNQRAPIFFESVQSLTDVQKRYGNVEFVNQRVVRRETLVKTLEALLLNNVLKVGNVYYLQKKGISQGSKVSSVLCAAYLSYVEKVLNVSKGFYDLFVRMEDEYLFISTMRNSAQDFLNDLIADMPKFECNINIKKCQASFDCEWGQGIGKLPKVSQIKFSGLILDPISLCVSSDYSRYEGLQASDVVTCRLFKNPGESLRNTVIRSLFPKCYTILFDDSINPTHMIEFNVLHIFCMTAVKFHFLVMSLPQSNRVDSNPSFFLEIILGLPAILHEHINFTLSKVISSQGKDSVFHVSIEKVAGLCQNAFLYKLRKNNDIYRKIIPLLEEKASHFPELSKNIVEKAFENVFLK